ncbi:MAG: GNAT family N-acetyltransferase [Opitutales bacterium]
MVIVRQIREEDAPTFREVLDCVCRERKYLAQLKAPTMEHAQAFVSANVKAGHPQFVAVEGRKIVGWCDAIPGGALSCAPHVGRLGMGVLKEYRRQKIGQRLIEATIKRASEIGLEKIELSVHASNEPAIALYRSIGFEEEGRKKRGWFVDGIYDDIVLMALALRKPDHLPQPTSGLAPGRGSS